MLLHPFWNGAIRNPSVMLVSWIDGFCPAFARAHPATVAAHVAALIRRTFQRPWSLELIARRFHVTPSHLRRGFQQEFGVSIHEYQTTRRVIEALHHMPEGKIEAIALEVGYKSKKDFYRAFQQVTGMKPTTFRSLSHARASRIAQLVDGQSGRRATAADHHRPKRPVCAQ